MAAVAQVSTSRPQPIRNATIDKAERVLFGKKQAESRVTLGAIHSLLTILENGGRDAEAARNILYHAKKAGKIFGSAEKRYEAIERIPRACRILFRKKKESGAVANMAAVHGLLDVVDENGPDANKAMELVFKAQGIGKVNGSAARRLQFMKDAARANHTLFGGVEFEDPMKHINGALYGLLGVVEQANVKWPVRNYAIELLMRAYGAGMFRKSTKALDRLNLLLPDQVAAHDKARASLLAEQQTKVDALRAEEAATRERRKAKQDRNKANRRERGERDRNRKPSGGGKEKNDKGKKGK